jgi:uncharacterized surface protein with fasciclin (FAS1) repeats
MMQKTGTHRMKKPIFPVLAVFPALLFFALFSCTKPATAPKPFITPLQLLINADTTLNFFHNMILQGNDAALLGTNAVTLLAPVDSGFLTAGYTLAIIDSMPAYLADGIVRYAFITGSPISRSPVVNSPYTTLLGIPVYLTRDSLSNIYFNGTRASLDTVNAGNAVVYKLQAPLQTPYDSLNQLLTADSNYSLLAEAFRQTGLYDSLGTGSYTLLAPDNTAFINAGYPDIPAIDSSNLTVLASLLKYQLASGLFFTNNLSAVSGLSSLQGEAISVSSQNGVFQFTGKNNSSPANMLSGNRLAGGNIVVHKTDQVLLP